jgi:hypothetical protein
MTPGWRSCPGEKWVEIAISADPLYQHLLLTAEKKFWRCVRFGDRPHLFGVMPPKPRIWRALMRQSRRLIEQIK